MSVAGDQIAMRPLSETGFTLFEVLVILAILALIAAIAFPSVDKAMRRQSFADAATRVEQGLYSARARALRTGSKVRFAVSADRREFGYGAELDRLPEDVVGSLSNGPIDFYPDGTAVGGSVSVVGLKFQRRWRVQSATGLIERVQ